MKRIFTEQFQKLEPDHNDMMEVIKRLVGVENGYV
jgi:hypothetical protein